MSASHDKARPQIVDLHEHEGRAAALLASRVDASGAPEAPTIEYGRSSDGFCVARVGDTAFAKIPAREGRHYLATGWRISRPLAGWTRADFFGHSGDLADEAAFRARVEENAEHQRERKALARIETFSRAHTPWGVSQGATIYADGVTRHSTAGHGGFHLSAERNREVPALLRAKDGHYEEDSAWAIVAITFPHLFTSFERRCAERTIKDFWPDAWEAISGAILAPGESHEKDRRAFEKQHAGGWVVISAITSRAHSGRVETVATLGGKRGADTEERRSCPFRRTRGRAFRFRDRSPPARAPQRRVLLRDPSTEGEIMTAELRKREQQLHRAEEARRQVQRQLAMIDRQIQRQMAAMIPRLQPKSPRHDRDTPTDAKAFLERYRANLAALTAARQPEIEALARKLARQDRALAELRQRLSDLSQARLEEPSSAREAHAASRHSSHGVFRRWAP